MASRRGKRTCTGIERASAWKQKPTLPIPRSNPASTGARPDTRLRRGRPVSGALDAVMALAPTNRHGQRLRSATADCASTSSSSSTTPMSPLSTPASANFAQPPPVARSPAGSGPHGAPISTLPYAPSSTPPPGAAWAPIRSSMPPYRDSPSSFRVESRYRAELSHRTIRL
jgi:hypothetical protein